MGRTRHTIMMAVAGTMAVGTLALGGVAAAAPGVGATGTAATTGTAPVAPLLSPGTGRLAHFDCTRAPHVLARIQRGEARIASGLPKLTAAEAKATAAGETRRSARIQKLITRFESPTLKTRLDKLATAIEAKCDVAAPAATNPPTTVPGA